MQFTDSTRSGLITPFEFPDRGGAEPRPVVAGEVKTAPQFEAAGILGVLAINGVKLTSDGCGENDRLFNPYVVHMADPCGDLLCSCGVGMRMHINDRKSGLGNLGHRDLVDGLR